MMRRRSALSGRPQPTLAWLYPDLLLLGLALIAGVLLWSLAYQVPVALDLAVGGDSTSKRREDDAPYLAGFHASEPSVAGRYDWWALDAGRSYRWATSSASITLPGAGAGQWVFSLTASSGRPDGSAVQSSWQGATGPRVPVTLAASPRVYHILVAANVAGDACLQMQTPAYAAPADPRDLGFVLSTVRVMPATAVPRIPALAQIGWLTASLGLIYLFTRWSGFLPRHALLVTSVYLLLTTWLLATERFALTLFTPTLTGLLLGCLLLAFGVSQAVRIVVPRGYTSTERLPKQQWHRQFKRVVALVLLAFALRMGGMLHPHAIFSDHRLHANNLLELALGSVYFREGLPTEAGGGQSPYPPGVYVLLAPLLLVASPDIESRVLIMQSGVAFLDSLVVAGIWALLVLARMGQRGAFLGAWLYLLPAPLLVSFAIGEYANIGGQALALPAIAWLGVAGMLLVPRSQGTTATLADPWVWLWVALLSIGLLGHLGILLSLGMLLLAAWIVAVWQQVSQRWVGSGASCAFSLRTLTIGPLVAGVMVGLFYYSAPAFQSFFAQRLMGRTGGTGEVDAQRSREILHLLQTIFAPYQRLTPLLIIGAFVGLALLRWPCRTNQRRQSLYFLLVAWWIGTLGAISLPLLLGASQGVRWPHFLYPALCLGGGVALATLWRRGYAGRLVALGSLAAILGYGLIIWLEQVRDYLH